MDSIVDIGRNPQLTVNINQTDCSIKSIGCYVKLTGAVDKNHIFHCIEESIGLFHQTYQQQLLKVDAFATDELPAPYKLIINERNFSAYANPASQVWQWLHEDALQQFVTSTLWSYHTYLIKISNSEYWFFLGCNGAHYGVDNLAEDRLYHLLNQFLSSPGIPVQEVDLLSHREKDLINKWSKCNVNFPRQKTIVDQFEESARKHPNAVAVVAKDAILTYAELNAQANQLAYYLRSVGMVADNLVPICMHRSSKMIVAILGILKAGGAYVPIDPGYPRERIEYILQDTAAAFVIGELSNSQIHPSHPDLVVIDLDKDWPTISRQPINNMPRVANPGSLAYIIYTSGTTGQPKGVMIEHKALMDHCYGIIKVAGLEKCKSFALFSPLVFDAGHSLIHSAFILGASLHVLSSELVEDGNKLLKYFNDNPIDCLKIVPSLWLSYALDDNIILANRVMIFGGESFATLIVDKLKASRYYGVVYNHYGPTEATIGKSIYKVNIEESYQVVPIGKPFSNTRFYIVDQQGRQAALGMPGELFIAGDGLARGYLNQSETTAKYFFPDTFSKLKGSKMYSTGDVVKWLANGNIEYLGRKDEQVKIRGHRIELSEIETVLNECSLIKQAVVLCRKNELGINRLEAFIVTSNDSKLKNIRDFTKNKLPDYMVPVTWHLLESFPLTVNGKIDKKALEQNFSEVRGTLKFKAPANKLQVQLEKIWNRLFEREKISTDEDFIEIGGHSLLAMRMVAAIRKELKTEVSVGAIFNYPNIALLSDHIESTAQHSALPLFNIQTKPARIPLSFSQGSLWFIHQSAGSLQYHLPSTYTISGNINKQALNEAFKMVLHRHEILRTVIREEDGQGYQLVVTADKWQLQFVDDPAYKKAGGSREDFIKDFIAKPFDLANDVMLRAALITNSDAQHELIYVIHHIASDGWSSSIFYNELIESYSSIIENRQPYLSELPVQYTDFAMWQQEIAKTGFWKEQLSYWKNNLSGITPVQLPTDYIRPVVQSSKGAKVDCVVTNDIFRGLQVVSKQHGATIFMTLAAALNVLLHRYTNQQDICIGTPTAGRNQQQTEPLIGYFINTLVLCNEVTSDLSFIDLLQKVTNTTLRAFDHLDVPFEKVVEVAVQERDVSRSPLFQVMLVLQNNTIETPAQLGNATIHPSATAADLHATSMFDATFVITESANGLQVSLKYATSLFKPASAERMLLHFKNLLKAIVFDPKCRIGSLDLLSKEEKQRLLVEFNHTKEPLNNNETILDLIHQQVLNNPNKIAAAFEEKKITYKELADRSDTLAVYLNGLGIYQKLVPVCIDHSIDMLVSIIAVLKAGGAYVPIDPEYPRERIQFIIGDTNATLVLCSKENRHTIEGDNKLRILEVDEDWHLQNYISSPASFPNVQSQDIAYVIYTSGSTGQPKGTLISHKGLAASSASRRQFYGNTGSMLLIPSYAFDSSVGVIFGTLVSGGTLVLCRHHQIKEPQTIRRLLQNTDTILCVPSYYRFLLEDGIIQDSSVSTVIVAGENLDVPLVNQHFAQTKNCKLFNEYGPTEGTVWATVAEIEPGKNITIGRPIETARVYIVNSNLQLVPEGVAGELCIGGPQVAIGYLNLQTKTSERFVDDTFEAGSINKMYKTGDLARWLPDGQIEFLGRIDDQIKIRGYRIELSEIETVLNECSLIKQAVVLCRKNELGINRLEAFIVTSNDSKLKNIRDFTKNKLPDYMVPVTWHLLESFPLTVNGKIDKKALEQNFSEVRGTLKFKAPANKLQVQLEKIWNRLFEREKISTDEDFIEIGGHSLLAMRMVAAIRKELKTEVSVGAIFNYPNIALLSDHIESTAQHSALPLFNIQTKPARIPLSFSQGSLWFIHQSAGSLQYHLPSTYTISGNINKQALNEAFKMVLHRHEILRTVIREEDGQGYQLVVTADKWQLQFVDDPAYKKAGGSREDFIKDFIAKPFDLANDVMLRAALITNSDAQHELIYVIHHIASDGWSSSIFYNELIESYSSIIENRQPYLSELPVQYTDFAMWQQEIAKTGFWKEQLSYWKNNLSGITPVQLPTDYIRPVVQSSKGAKVDCVVTNDIFRGLQVVSKQHGATIFMTLAAALNVLLHRYTNQQDICIGTPTAGRNQQQTEPLIGYFINTLVLCNEVTSDLSFIDLLQKVTNTTLRAFDHLDVPFEKVVEVAVQERDVSRSPLFQVMLVLQNNTIETPAQLGNATIHPSATAADLHATSMFDATFVITESANGLQVSLKYATSLFKPASAERMLLHFKNLLKAIVFDPKCRIGSLDLLSKEEKQRLLVEFNHTKEPLNNNETILDLIHQQVLNNPNKIAAAFEEKKITYKELADRSDTLAVYLNGLGIYQKLVPVCIDHSIDMLVSIIAVLKAGGAYVPIDPEYPRERIQFIIGDTNATLVLCSKENRHTIEGDNKLRILEVDEDWHLQNYISSPASFPNVQSQDIAYVIYTSGSTGQPKGTLISHKGLAASSASRRQFYGNTGSMLLIPSYAFDSSVGVIFGTLVSGGTLVLCRHHQIKEPQTIRRLLQNTDTILCVPSYYRFLLEDGIIQDSSVSTVIVAGENLDVPLVNQHFAQTKNCKLFNEYGPTEGTVWATVAEIEPGKNITIGRPIETARVYIVNSNLQLVPEGVAGELCIGGPQVAIGYLNLQTKTSERFVDDTFEAGSINKMYKTGDLARWLPDGQIEFLGRIDDQIKIRGYRIEPSGIEQSLSECEGIQQAVVVAKSGNDGTSQLVAYVIVEGKFDPLVYTRFLKERLPLFMIPGQWVQMQEFTLTPNGKIDKKALTEIEIIEVKTAHYAPPTTATEQDLAKIWQQLLSSKRISIHDNFFTLGGHSLLAMRLVSAIQKKIKVTISINDLFMHPTIAELANCLENRMVNPLHEASKFKYLVPVKPSGNKVPLYIVAGGGSTALRFKNFSEMLDAEQPVYVFQSPVDEAHLVNFPTTIEGLAQVFLKELLELNPAGPYALAGHCIGGIIAFEMARHLKAAGKEVQALVLFDTIVQDEQLISGKTVVESKWKTMADKLISKIALKVQFEYFLLTRHFKIFLEYRIKAVRKHFKTDQLLTSTQQQQKEADLNIFKKAETIYAAARAQYVLIKYNGPITLFVAKERYFFIDEVQNIKFKKLTATINSNKYWEAHCTRLDIIETEGNHSDMFNKDHGTTFSRGLQQILNFTKVSSSR